MNTPVIAFFSSQGGVGKTSLVYHIAHMVSDSSYRVVAADLDPQGHLSAAFLDDDRLEGLWPADKSSPTIYGALLPLKRGIGDVEGPALEKIHERLVLIPGDMGLSEYEDELFHVWPKCLDRDERAFRVISAFWRVLQKGAARHRADVILVDLGPNLGSINRAALIASDYVVIPLGADLFSLQGLRNLGPTLRSWRSGWQERLAKQPGNAHGLELPPGDMAPIGYIVTQHSVRRDRPVRSYDKWMAMIPGYYEEYVLGQSGVAAPTVADDRNCLALLKHYRSLMPMAQEARKPMFALKPADGALGAHTYAVKDAYRDFHDLAIAILRRTDIFDSQRKADATDPQLF